MLTGSCLCGAVHWTFNGDPGSATACNCSACRRYGALWIYDYEGERITVTGPVTAFTRPKGASLSFNFCSTCGCIVSWRALKVDDQGRRRTAVNVRLCDDPTAVMSLAIDHFDGADSFDDLPRDGRTVGDMWF